MHPLEATCQYCGNLIDLPSKRQVFCRRQCKQSFRRQKLGRKTKVEKLEKKLEKKNAEYILFFTKGCQGPDLLSRWTMRACCDEDVVVDKKQICLLLSQDKLS